MPQRELALPEAPQLFSTWVSLAQKLKVQGPPLCLTDPLRLSCQALLSRAALAGVLFSRICSYFCSEILSPPAPILASLETGAGLASYRREEVWLHRPSALRLLPLSWPRRGSDRPFVGTVESFGPCLLLLPYSGACDVWKSQTGLK